MVDFQTSVTGNQAFDTGLSVYSAFNQAKGQGVENTAAALGALGGSAGGAAACTATGVGAAVAPLCGIAGGAIGSALAKGIASIFGGGGKDEGPGDKITLAVSRQVIGALQGVRDGALLAGVDIHLKQLQQWYCDAANRYLVEAYCQGCTGGVPDQYGIRRGGVGGTTAKWLSDSEVGFASGGKQVSTWTKPADGQWVLTVPAGNYGARGYPAGNPEFTSQAWALPWVPWTPRMLRNGFNFAEDGKRYAFQGALKRSAIVGLGAVSAYVDTLNESSRLDVKKSKLGWFLAGGAVALGGGYFALRRKKGKRK